MKMSHNHVQLNPHVRSQTNVRLMLELDKKILRLCVGGVQRTWHSNGASKHHLPFVISCPFVPESAVRVSSRRRDLPFMVIPTHRKRCHHHRSRFEKAFLRSMCRPLESAVFVLWNINDRWSRHRAQTPDNHVAPIPHPSNQQRSTKLASMVIALDLTTSNAQENRMVSKISMSLHLDALAARRSEDISSCQAGQ